MNLFFILLLLALIASGYYVYQYLLRLEREIRAEQQIAANAEESSDIKPVASSSVSEPPLEVIAEHPVSEELEVRDRIMFYVEGSPGLAQTELYTKISDVDRRELQKVLRELDQAGRLRREKQGSSYQLYPL